MGESQATEVAKEAPEVFESVNQWFLSLPAERQAILRDDKWMLAEAAFAAGRAIGRQEADHLIKYSYVALRERDGSTWGGQYFEDSGCGYAHERSISNAFRAKSVEALHDAMIKRMCGYGGVAQAIGQYSILKIARNKVVEEIASGVVPIAMQAARLRAQGPFRADPVSSVFMGMNPWIANIARSSPSPEDIEWAWHYVCAASHVIGVVLPGSPSEAADLKSEMKDALEKLGETIRAGNAATAGVSEIGRLAAAVIKIAETAGVKLVGKGFEASRG